MIHADYADNLMLFTNTPALAESFLHSLEQAAGSIDFYMDANKIGCMSFKQEKTLST